MTKVFVEQPLAVDPPSLLNNVQKKDAFFSKASLIQLRTTMMYNSPGYNGRIYVKFRHGPMTTITVMASQVKALQQQFRAGKFTPLFKTTFIRCLYHYIVKLNILRYSMMSTIQDE